MDARFVKFFELMFLCAIIKKDIIVQKNSGVQEFNFRYCTSRLGIDRKVFRNGEIQKNRAH